MAPAPIAVAIAFATAKFSSVAIPLITLYLLRFEYCRMAPNENPRTNIKTIIFYE
jgi:hypothetical protein